MVAWDIWFTDETSPLHFISIIVSFYHNAVSGPLIGEWDFSNEI